MEGEAALRMDGGGMGNQGTRGIPKNSLRIGDALAVYKFPPGR